MFDGTRLLGKDRYDNIKSEYDLTNEDMQQRYGFCNTLVYSENLKYLGVGIFGFSCYTHTQEDWRWYAGLILLLVGQCQKVCVAEYLQFNLVHMISTKSICSRNISNAGRFTV